VFLARPPVEERVGAGPAGAERYPEILIEGACPTIEKLRTQAQNLTDEQDRLQREMDNIHSERQWVITQARKKAITEEDMDMQLGALTFQELELKRQLSELSASSQLINLDNWEDAVRMYLADVSYGVAALDGEPANDEERAEQERLKRLTVKTLVERVNLDKDRNLEVVIQLNVQEILKNAANVAVPVQPVGICSHTPTCRARRLRAARA
jgi:hypothetical protein